MYSQIPVKSSLKMATDSLITIRDSVDICLISSICMKELSKKSNVYILILIEKLNIRSRIKQISFVSNRLYFTCIIGNVVSVIKDVICLIIS